MDSTSKIKLDISPKVNKFEPHNIYNPQIYIMCSIYLNNFQSFFLTIFILKGRKI